MILEDVETSLNLALPCSWDFSCVSVSLLHSLLSNMSLMIDVWDRTIEGRLTSLKRDIVVTGSRTSDTTLMYQPWSSDQKKETTFGLEMGTKKYSLRKSIDLNVVSLPPWSDRFESLRTIMIFIPCRYASTTFCDTKTWRLLSII